MIRPEIPCTKVPYESEIEALIAAATHLKLNKESEAFYFKPYKCQHCGKIHLTKGRLEILFDIGH